MPIILLHGWGCDSNTFNEVISYLKEQYLVYAIDLPGFGKSEVMDTYYTLDDYVELIKVFIKDKNIIDPIILGHSFGGRIAIKYASLYKVNKLILVDSAGIRPKNYLYTKIKIMLYKLKKHWYKLTKNVMKYHNLIKNSGSDDYKKASLNMKMTLTKIVNENLDHLLKQIKAETLIIWGKNDNTTPLRDAKKLHRKIKNSGLVVIEGVGHFPYLDAPYYFRQILKAYLGVK